MWRVNQSKRKNNKSKTFVKTSSRFFFVSILRDDFYSRVDGFRKTENLIISSRNHHDGFLSSTSQQTSHVKARQVLEFKAWEFSLFTRKKKLFWSRIEEKYQQWISPKTKIENKLRKVFNGRISIANEMWVLIRMQKRDRDDDCANHFWRLNCGKKTVSSDAQLHVENEWWKHGNLGWTYLKLNQIFGHEKFGFFKNPNFGKIYIWS